MRNVGDRFSQFNKTAPTEPDIMPQTNFGGGMHGYSSFPGFQQQMAALEKMYPGMAAMLRGFQKNPFTPASGTSNPNWLASGQTPAGSHKPNTAGVGQGANPPSNLGFGDGRMSYSGAGGEVRNSPRGGYADWSGAGGEVRNSPRGGYAGWFGAGSGN
jgi:hypothetical protein